uniref:Uncharacterized protein HLSG-g22 n=1 Tax=Haemaphysalis longicornis TaxID=44386 RepID=Q4R189_HAELO|nr:hypothetical protein [Haemaphysalis longicornis]
MKLHTTIVLLSIAVLLAQRCEGDDARVLQCGSPCKNGSSNKCDAPCGCQKCGDQGVGYCGFSPIRVSGR